MKLEWKEWISANGVPREELLLIEVERSYDKYQSGVIHTGANGGPIGTFGGQFYFDWDIIRWASIQHLIKDESND